MSKGKNSPNISRLVSQIRQISLDAQDHSEPIDFGVIQSDKSLICDGFDVPIPKDDYLICRSLSHGTIVTTEVNGHKHNVKIPALKQGDRVLVAWLGNDAIVIDVLTDAADVWR